MKKSILTLVILFTLISLQSMGQELRATVKVLSPEVQATNKDIFQTLETSMENFLNVMPLQITNTATKSASNVTIL